MNLRRFAIASLAVLVAATAPAVGAELRSEPRWDAPASAALRQVHVRSVTTAVERVLAQDLLTPEQAFWTRQGLERFRTAATAGQSLALVDAGWDGAALDAPKPELKELVGAPKRARKPKNRHEDLISGFKYTCWFGDQLLLNHRFIASVTYENLLHEVYTALACGMTHSAGYFFFSDPANVEIPMKMLNACGGGNPPTHWVFAAGLTNFGVQLTIFDLFTGTSRTYTNPTGQFFELIIDQQTPFPCP